MLFLVGLPPLVDYWNRPLLSRGKTVLIVGHIPPPYTGQTVAVDILVKGLPEYGWRVEVCDTGGGMSSERLSRAVRSRGVRRLKEVVYALMRLCRQLSKTDVVYVTIAQSVKGFLRDSAVILLAKAAGRPIVAHLHGGNYRAFYFGCNSILRLLIRFSLRAVCKIVVPGELLRDQFSFDPVLYAKLEVIQNTIPFQMNEDPVPKKDWRPEVPLRVLFLSNMHKSKGYMDVFEACRILLRRGVEFKCVFCGQFPDNGRNDFKRRIYDCGLGHCVQYDGRVLGKRKMAELEAGHVMALPTSYVNEGQPISVIEGMACAQAILTTEYRGLPELVEDGKNGFFVEAGSPDQIAARLEQLAGDRHLLMAMCRASGRKFQAEFRPERHIGKVAQVLTTAFARKNGRGR